LEAAAKSSPNDVELIVTLAESYRNAGLANQAIPLYRRAIALDPTQLTAPVGLASILFQQGNYEESIRLWKDALAKNAGLDLVRTNLAMAQWQSGDLAGAEASLRKAIEISPGFQPAADLLKTLERRGLQ
jgi:tetratricopeptide (TPR) repeat protein